MSRCHTVINRFCTIGSSPSASIGCSWFFLTNCLHLAMVDTSWRRRSCCFSRFGMLVMIRVAGRISGNGWHSLHFLKRNLVLDVSNGLRHFPHTRDDRNSSTKSMSKTFVLLSDWHSIRVPGQRLYFFIGESGLKLAAPINTNAGLFPSIWFRMRSMNLVLAI